MKWGSGILCIANQNKFLFVPFFLPWLFISSCEKSYPSPTSRINPNYITQYAAIFVPAHPQDSTNAYGTVSATYNSFYHEFNYTIHWNMLTSLPLAIHIHDLDSIMIALPVFPRVLSDSIAGTSHLTSKQADDLSSGYIYVLIATIKYPYGEVMASLDKQ
jgi:CHRD domain-containing protein